MADTEFQKRMLSTLDRQIKAVQSHQENIITLERELADSRADLNRETAVLLEMQKAMAALNIYSTPKPTEEPTDG